MLAQVDIYSVRHYMSFASSPGTPKIGNHSLESSALPDPKFSEHVDMLVIPLSSMRSFCLELNERH